MLQLKKAVAAATSWIKKGDSEKITAERVGTLMTKWLFHHW
jgi:hypothetical protein